MRAAEWPTWQRIVLAGTATVIAAAVLIAVVIALAGTRGGFIERCIVSMLAVGLACATLLAAAWTCVRRGWRLPAACGAGVSVITLALFLYLVWDRPAYPFSRKLEECLVVGVAWGLMLVLLALLSLARLHRSSVWIRWVTQGLSVVLAGYATYATLAPVRDDPAVRIIAVLAILTGAGVLAVVVLHWVTASRSRSPGVTTALVLRLTCPRCGCVQELPAGAARCRQCGLRLRIEIEEELCRTCGYPLYGLTSDRCPECGAPLAELSAPGESHAGER